MIFKKFTSNNHMITLGFRESNKFADKLANEGIEELPFTAKGSVDPSEW